MARGSLHHEALIYGSDGEFLDALVPFVSAGLSAGEPVVAVVPEARADLLQRELGSGVPGLEYVDAVSWYRRPLDTIAGYQAKLDALLASGVPRVRVIGEVQFGAGESEQAEWTKYEASLNAVLASRSAWVVCPYDSRALPDRVVQNARRTHPTVASGRSRRPSPEYAWPQHLVRQMSPAPDVTNAAVLFEMALPPASPAGVRRAMSRAAASLGMPRDRAYDLVCALNEVVSNALRHGRGDVEVTAWWTGRDVVGRVVDHGGGVSDHLAGYEPPNPGCRREGGLGLWVARGLADRVVFVDGDDSFAVWVTVGCRAAG